MKPGSFRGSLLRLWKHVPTRRRRQLGLLLVLMLFGACAELLSLGAVVPFVGALADPAATSRIPVIARTMASLGITVDQLPWAVSGLFATMVLLAAGVRLLLMWATIRYANGLGAELGCRLYEKTLHRPYSFHVSRNTSQIIGSINKVQRVIIGYVIPVLSGVTAAILAIAIVALLTVVEPAVAAGGAAVFLSSYLLIAYRARRGLKRYGTTIAKANDQRVQAVQEGLGGIRDVILDQAQKLYVRRFSLIESRFRDAQAKSQFIGSFPRLAVEAIGMLMLVGLAIYFNSTGRDLGELLPVLGVLAVGSAKLMPLIQQGYAGWSSVVSSQASVNDVLNLLDFDSPLQPDIEPIPFDRSIRIENMGFRYGESADGEEVLRNVTLEIRRGEKIGLAGATGSGKSTLADLFMGLLSPTSGEFLVDGQRITPGNAPAWQRHIAHVPQSIYLSDSSIAENIAFGIEPSRIDRARVESAARAAQIHEHIVSLPHGYSTSVGERGVRLSGGQRQRIGIARALYKKVDVLVLDEATSALDDETEFLVMKGIENLSERTTVLMIAHRLTTMRGCDRIVRLDAGRIVEVTDYEDFIRKQSTTSLAR